MHTAFTIGEAFKFGWHKTKQHSMVLFQVLLTLFALQVAQALVQRGLAGELIGVLALLAIIAAEFVVSVGLIRITLRIARDESAHYADISPNWQVIWRFALVSLLIGCAVFFGLILLVVPGIYLALRFSMARFSILDGHGVMESLSRSSALTKGIKWKLFGFFLVSVLLNIAGALLFMVGLLVTVPVTMLAYAHIYQKLSVRHRQA